MDAALGCKLCSSGTYQSVSGVTSSAACLRCGSGTYQTGTGMGSSSNCTLCSAGTYQSDSGSASSSCILCGAGTYQSGLGFSSSASCLLCSAGTYGTGMGFVSASNCTAGVSIEEILGAVGDDGSASSRSAEIALRPWSRVVVSEADFSLILTKILSVPRPTPVTLLAVPGLIMKTIPGTNYSQLKFRHDSRKPANSNKEMSSSTIFATAVNPRRIFVQLNAFRFSGSGRRAAQCPAGVEWRYAKVGAPEADACKCPPNPNCDGATSCNVIPQAGEEWQVLAVSTSLCSSSDDNSRAVGLGVGLGIGLPIVLGMVYLAYKSMLTKEPVKEKQVPPQPSVALPTPMVVEPAVVRMPAVGGAQPPPQTPQMQPSVVGQLTYVPAPPQPMEPATPQPFSHYNDLDDIYSYMPMFDPYSEFQVASQYSPRYTL